MTASSHSRDDCLVPESRLGGRAQLSTQHVKKPLMSPSADDVCSDLVHCCRFDCLNTVTALSHSRDDCLAPGGSYVVLFDSAKQESELAALRKEEQLVKVRL